MKNPCRKVGGPAALAYYRKRRSPWLDEAPRKGRAMRKMPLVPVVALAFLSLVGSAWGAEAKPASTSTTPAAAPAAVSAQAQSQAQSQATTPVRKHRRHRRHRSKALGKSPATAVKVEPGTKSAPPAPSSKNDERSTASRESALATKASKASSREPHLKAKASATPTETPTRESTSPEADSAGDTPPLPSDAVLQNIRATLAKDLPEIAAKVPITAEVAPDEVEPEAKAAELVPPAEPTTNAGEPSAAPAAPSPVTAVETKAHDVPKVSAKPGAKPLAEPGQTRLRGATPASKTRGHGGKPSTSHGTKAGRSL